MFSNLGVLGTDHQHRASSDFEDSSTTMLNHVVNQPDRLSLDEIPSPIGSQLFEFCDPDLFQSETLTNSEVASSSNNCCFDENSINPDLINNNNNNNSNMSIIFDSQDENDNDISASIDFSPSSPFTVPPYINNNNSTTFDLSSDIIGLCQYPVHDRTVPIIGNHLLPSVFEEDCLSSVPSFLRNNNNNNNSFIDVNMTSYFPNFSGDGGGANQFCGEYPMICGSEMQQHDLEYQGDNGRIYCTESMQRLLNSGELQALNTENQQIVLNGGGSCTTPSSSELSSLEESTFKVGKLSVEQRKEKIYRYMKKRNERNFSKKIKYACRKTLADSRPRVRGRFAKNDEFGDGHRPNSGNHDEDDDEDLIRVKEEDDMAESSDIFAHISGVNSFKCNYSIQSWI